MSLSGDGNAKRTWVILDNTGLFKMVTLPMGVIFLQVQALTICLMESSFTDIFALVIFSIVRTSYSMPSAVNLVTQPRLFSLPNRLSDSLMFPILITFVFVMLIFKPDLM